MSTTIRSRTFTACRAVLLAAAVVLSSAAYANQWAAEGGVSLNGTRMTYFQQPDQARCLDTCANDASCAGATWIAPGTYNRSDPAMCYLLSSVSGRASARGHVSMVKTTAGNAGGSGSANAPLTGRWTWAEGSKNYYHIQQNGITFTWTSPAINEPASGTIHGDELTLQWQNSGGPGKANGKITARDAQGRAMQIKWTNGITFVRND